MNKTKQKFFYSNRNSVDNTIIVQDEEKSKNQSIFGLDDGPFNQVNYLNQTQRSNLSKNRYGSVGPILKSNFKRKLDQIE